MGAHIPACSHDVNTRSPSRAFDPSILDTSLGHTTRTSDRTELLSESPLPRYATRRKGLWMPINHLPFFCWHFDGALCGPGPAVIRSSLHGYAAVACTYEAGRVTVRSLTRESTPTQRRGWGQLGTDRSTRTYALLRLCLHILFSVRELRLGSIREEYVRSRFLRAKSLPISLLRSIVFSDVKRALCSLPCSATVQPSPPAPFPSLYPERTLSSLLTHARSPPPSRGRHGITVKASGCSNPTLSWTMRIGISAKFSKDDDDEFVLFGHFP
ncbi:hypothetical protein EW146_g8085 [Bondarzewia mesenterica]|uniref:Uncharacterized protein n=1 Tax=Bondarzewia mesenterica TaxID=1095465 RepID=A0A4S4LHA1_9AGAM|nr:hypothetical protein EW146_g8085 [Bondarzewia mesenterica]